MPAPDNRAPPERVKAGEKGSDTGCNSPVIAVSYFSAFLAAFLLALAPLGARAQSNVFAAQSCAGATGREATIVLNLPAPSALPQTDGWITLSTRAAGCVGQAALHEGLRTVTVSGDDPLTPEVDGARAGDTLHVELFDAAGHLRALRLDVALDGKACFMCSGQLVYANDALFVVEHIAAQSSTAAGERGVDEAAVGALYPNPTRAGSVLQVALASAEPVEVALYDALGREVLRAHDGLLPAGTSPVRIETEGLSSGSYLVRISSASLSETRSLVVVR